MAPICAYTLQGVSQKIQILRDTDPRCNELEATGYTLVGESWGARLFLDAEKDLSIYSEAIHKVSENGIHVQELDVSFTDALLKVELINNPDYPYTPATFHSVPTAESTQALWRSDNLIFGAIHNEVLVGAVATSRKRDKDFLAVAQGVPVIAFETSRVDEIVEIDFGSLLKEYRGKGIGKAMLAAAILAWAKSGIRIFATGGASINNASLGIVRSLGFSVEEKWRSYQIND
jgi:GNAT superfamily N-acetyltransferase